MKEVRSVYHGSYYDMEASKNLGMDVSNLADLPV